VDFERIEADLKDGILTVNIRKKEERPKLIQLK
jgi:HSP20 family molecular chaperone IbpA